MDILIFCKSLSDPTRIRLLNLLYRNELSVNEIVSVLDMGQSRISRHLKILTDAGLLDCRRDGVWAYYSAASVGTGHRFVETNRELFEAEPHMESDLVRALEVLEARRTSTTEFFDTIASEWDRLRREILGPFDINGALLNAVAIPCGVALDLGCGTGELLCGLARKADRVIGVDYSTEMLAEARRRCEADGVDPDLRIGAIEHLPLGDREADLAVVSLALHHLADPEAGLKDIGRVVRPGGQLLVADFDKHENEYLRKAFGDRWLGFSEPMMARYLAAGGFEMVDFESVPLRLGLTLNLYRCVRSA